MDDLFLFYLGQDWWKGKTRRKQILNQKFATVLSDDDLSNGDVHLHKGFKSRPRMPASMKSSGLSEVKIDEYWFEVYLDLDEFDLGELSVNIYDRYFEVHGKQEEKRDQYGFVSREFRRQYIVPKNCNIKALTSTLSTDNKLKIKVPLSPKEQRIVDPPSEVSVAEKEFNPNVMELKQEKYIKIAQKILSEMKEKFYETNMKTSPACNITKKDAKIEINQNSEESHILDNVLCEMISKPPADLVTVTSTKLPADLVTVTSTKLPADLVTITSTKLPADLVTITSTKLPADLVTVTSTKLPVQ